MEKVPSKAAGIVTFSSTFASLAVLGFAHTAELFVIVIGMVIIYRWISLG